MDMEREFRSTGNVSFNVYHIRVNERLGTSYVSTIISNFHRTTGWILEPPPYESL